MNLTAGARGPVPAGAAPRAFAFALWLAAALASGAGAALGLPLLASPPPSPFSTSPPASRGAGFALTAPDGSIVTAKSLRGAPFVVMFGYTGCGAPCTRRLARVLDWRRQVAGNGASERLPVLFVSVDPERDTPARMAAFAARAPGPVLALTGSEAAVARAAQGFNATYFKAALCGGGTIINHSEAAYLVAKDGRIEAAITPDERTPSALAKLRALISG